MIILRDKNISNEMLFEIKYINDISNTKSNSTVLFEYDLELMKYCKANEINYAVKVTTIQEAIYSNLLQAKYIIVKKKISKTIQKMADDYMYDSKVIVEIKNIDQLQWVASYAIDGVIYT